MNQQNNTLFEYLFTHHRSQSVGAAKGVMGDSGRGGVEETAGERPPPGSAAEEAQSTLSLAL